MPLPKEFLDSLAGLPGFDLLRFEMVHEEQQPPVSIRINSPKCEVSELLFDPGTRVPWTSTGYYLDQRPAFTFDPLFHAGSYYVQEASSMFLEQALKQHADLNQSLKVLDLSAAPGGKTTHLLSLLSDKSLLVSNEVVRARCNILADNVIKWGRDNVVISNNDPSVFALLPSYFDILVVDAPCSGSGLFRKDPDALQEWSLHNVNLCSQRQQQILSAALPCLKEGGLLIYSTCSYSKLEDEAIADWLIEQDMEPLKIKTDQNWNIVESISDLGAFAYRFYPDQLKGEGFFLSAFRKSTEQKKQKTKEVRVTKIPQMERKIIQSWIVGDFEAFYHKNEIMAVPEHLFGDMGALFGNLQIVQSGIIAGQIMKNRLVPHHSLAQSLRLSSEIPDLPLSYEGSIRFLQRQDITEMPSAIGWQTVSFRGHRLGWINALQNRMNNYYPKEIRILKQHNDSVFKNL